MNSTVFFLLLLIGFEFSRSSLLQSHDEMCAYCFSLIVFEVCGTDGKTYRNLCELKRASCLARKKRQPSIAKLHLGRCNDSLA